MALRVRETRATLGREIGGSSRATTGGYAYGMVDKQSERQGTGLTQERCECTPAAVLMVRVQGDSEVQAVAAVGDTVAGYPPLSLSLRELSASFPTL
jgi:hypothetical protein